MLMVQGFSKIAKCTIMTIIRLLPETRLYRSKSMLFRIAGVKCRISTRITSSASILHDNTHIGSDTFIGHGVIIAGDGCHLISIGDNVDIAPRVTIVNGTHEIDMIGQHSAGEGTGRDIIIEDGVWIGASSVILPGITIGRKSIIGAGSVVVNDIPPFCVAVGNPCRPIKWWNQQLGVFEKFVQ